MSLKITRKTQTVDAPSAPPTSTPPPKASPESRVRPLVPPKSPSSAKNKTRVLLQVLDGRIEWEKMTPDSRKQFEELFKDKEFLQQFGLNNANKMFDPQQIKHIYGAMSMMYQTVVKLFLKWPEPALKMLAYSEDQKEALAEPTANLANRFAPMFLQKNQELIVWLAVFGACTQKNFTEASEQARKMMAQPQPKNPAPVTVITPRANATPAAPAPADRVAPTISVPFTPPAPAKTERVSEIPTRDAESDLEFS